MQIRPVFCKLSSNLRSLGTPSQMHRALGKEHQPTEWQKPWQGHHAAQICFLSVWAQGMWKTAGNHLWIGINQKGGKPCQYNFGFSLKTWQGIYNLGPCPGNKWFCSPTWHTPNLGNNKPFLAQNTDQNLTPVVDSLWKKWVLIALASSKHTATQRLKNTWWGCTKLLNFMEAPLSCRAT